MNSKRKSNKAKKKHSMKPFIEMLATSTIADEAIEQGAKEFRKSIKKFPSKPYIEFLMPEKSFAELMNLDLTYFRKFRRVY